MPALMTLLERARNGDKDAIASAFALLYNDLHRLARARLRPHRTMTLLDTTALLHESFLRLSGLETVNLESRHHFIAYASRVMRSVIVDIARSRSAERRGGNADHLALDTHLGEQIALPENDALRVHHGLEVLEKIDPRMAQVVERRFFGGLTEVEVAQSLGITERTVRRDWDKARALLVEVLA